MIRFHEDYRAAEAEAQRWANRSGISVGLTRTRRLSSYPPGYLLSFLPAPEKRFGSELRCQVVDPEEVP